MNVSALGPLKKCTKLSQGVKCRYRGFDTIHGKDVAWNEIVVTGLPEKEKQRFVSEVELLRYLDNAHFIKYYSSWYDASQDKIILITQIVTSGTLSK